MPDTIASPLIRMALSDLRERVSGRFGSRVRWVRLFGSWARFEANEYSDVDVSVVIDRLTRDEWGEVVSLADDVALKYGLPISALVDSAEAFDASLARGAGVAADIVREGIVA